MRRDRTRFWSIFLRQKKGRIRSLYAILGRKDKRRGVIPLFKIPENTLILEIRLRILQ